MSEEESPHECYTISGSSCLDFANITVYPPEEYPGLIVLRVADQSRAHVLQGFTHILDLIDQEPLSGHLWIVEDHQVRIRGAKEEL